ncbi:hypothetical protein P175DRAFT_0512147 [Aspergillus ochraceoroseus IBT 24754]|uniref:Uncharacterized protein n=2 Tax=Aspergillus ochraceoroseus TaxID=138278 RepID=A0A2T5LM87_9EURO|nr:uncharacterized protein P175DRAFT_0512147 [Aspergillus ochraceoroseus IBT 24754]KKK25539.1 hypothetical protein AOCH_001360 [Aspergillus ochraceoroseus]PTU17396.1 hypothetical protein P175DRAFT_0512147 [Aspergillus ochraceoroseus IBT 24754]
MTQLLSVYPTRNQRGRSISGPAWKWVDGQCLDKFIRGREVRQIWQQYGPVYRIWSGFTPEIVITRPEDIRAFHTDSASHSKSTSSNGGWMFHQILGDCMGLINGGRWKRIRAQYDPYFVHRVAMAHSGPILQNVEATLASIDGVDPTTLHVANSFSRFPFMATAEYLYGPLTDAEKEEVWSLGQRSLRLMGYVLSGSVYRFRLYHWLKPDTHRELLQFEEHWIGFNKRIYTTRQAYDPSLPIVTSWKEVVEGRITKKEMVQTMSEMLFANLDVSTNVLGWLVIFLAQDVQIQAQLRAEIKNQTSTLQELCNRKDSLLHHCFLESLRLRPFTVFTIPESSPEKKVLGGYLIPANTSVVVDTLAINYNPEFWGHKSADFNPYRFKNLSPTQLRYNLFSFGFGTRKCLGQHFAEAMMKLFICQLLSRYQIGLPRTEKQKDGDYKTSKDAWVPIADVEVNLRPL